MIGKVHPRQYRPSAVQPPRMVWRRRQARKNFLFSSSRITFDDEGRWFAKPQLRRGTPGHLSVYHSPNATVEHARSALIFSFQLQLLKGKLYLSTKLIMVFHNESSSTINAPLWSRQLQPELKRYSSRQSYQQWPPHGHSYFQLGWYSRLSHEVAVGG